MNNLQRALLSIEGWTFEDSKEMINKVKEIDAKYSTLQSSDWIVILKHLQESIVIGFEVEHCRNRKDSYK